MTRPRRGERAVVVASYKDLHRARPRPIVLLEHGAGQHYGDRNPSNPGGGGREGVVLFLCPNEDVAARNAEWYQVPTAVIGCPKMDRWHRAAGFSPSDEEPKREPTVAVSFHWDCHQCPESRWAFPHFRPALAELAHRYEVLGHGHPRALRHLEPSYLDAGIEPVRDFEEVLERADVYVCDNSSTIPEAASVAIPIVFLDAPWYRREVHHGGRFWEWPGGQVQCDNPENIIPAIFAALDDLPAARGSREAMVRSVYAYTDGRATERAVAALRELPDTFEVRRGVDPFSAHPR